MRRTKTYGSLKRMDGKWVISGLEPHVAIRLKQLFPKIPQHKAGTFSFVDNKDVAADLEWFISRYALAIDKADLRYLKKRKRLFYTEQEKAESILLPSYVPRGRVGLKEGQFLKEYQKQAIDLIEQVQSLLVIDDVGLGKTYEGLGIALIENALPLVVVVEPHLQDQWIEKAESFINLSVHAVKGNTPYDLPPVDIYVFKYTQLGPWVDVLTQGWVGAIAFDEVQQLRTGVDSAKGYAAKYICEKIPIRVGLTATLIYNFGIEAWNIIDIIRPGLLGTKNEFIREWCSGNQNGKFIVKDPDALGAYLRESMMTLRRKKSDVGQEAKQMAPHIEWVEPNQKLVASAEALAEKLALKTLTANFQEAGMAAREFDMKMREMTGIAKASQTAAYARMFVETGTPVVLFGYHHEVYRIWEEELGDLNPLFYTGRQSQAQKEKSKKAFINGESDLLIMSLRSGAGTDGIQHRCSTVIKGEFDWSPKVHEQCIGRVDRDGQKEEVFVFYVATNFGSDPEIIDLLGLKESQSRGIIDPCETPVSQQADVNRIKKLAERFLESKGMPVPVRQTSIKEVPAKALSEAI
ncbi:DEAD/DEAH box helicase [Alteromonas sp. 14N.309.X.WAT.G.H12]|uniref:DEAD/DEAH box helicase n=1 Tax=Alteromonas sp. 14N.309.X.WAT.G.H12 TaxID=3120824 RepID=UPI002FD0AC2B